MRADRLLSLLMLLQTRGKLTARELAGKLEVSERTIYRDIDALSAAGVPVYGEPGRAGGFDLLDSYRTNLTGMNEGELRALFMLGIPAPLTELGVGQDLQAALLKLSAALPDSHRQDEISVRQRFHLDSTWWRQGQEPVPHLRTIEQAVWGDRRLAIRYRPLYTTELEQVVDPYGLVAKAGVWYLVYARVGRTRAQRVADLRDVRLTNETFERPGDFDLAGFWKAWCAEHERGGSHYRVTVRVAPHFIPEMAIHFGERVKQQLAAVNPPDEKGRITLELSFERLESARARLLGLGNGIEVLEPIALRTSIQDYAMQIIVLYQNTGNA
jgi:predicted DNA-binding transcriptional regulator YafY